MNLIHFGPATSTDRLLILGMAVALMAYAAWCGWRDGDDR